MTELKALSPAAGLLPLNIGGVELREDEMRALTLIAPYKGQEAALAKALEAAHGLSWPTVGTTSGSGAARLVWFGRGAALLVGAEASAKLAKHAALTDQTDAWSCLTLEGAGARDVLARLTPLDMRDVAFPVGPLRGPRSFIWLAQSHGLARRAGRSWGSARWQRRWFMTSRLRWKVSLLGPARRPLM